MMIYLYSQLVAGVNPWSVCQKWTGAGVFDLTTTKFWMLECRKTLPKPVSKASTIRKFLKRAEARFELRNSNFTPVTGEELSI